MSATGAILPEQYIQAAQPWDQLALFDFADGNLSYVYQPSAQNVYFSVLVNYLNTIVALETKPSGKVICSLHDAICKAEDNFPKLAFCRPAGDESCYLLPDPFYISESGYIEAHNAFDRMNLSWEERVPVAYFRGSSTGGNITFEKWRENKRVQLALLSLIYPSLLSAKITKIVQEEEPGVGAELSHAGIVSDFEPFETSVLYRYLIDIDGNANAYSYILKLSTGSLVFKVQSKLEQWFYPWLKPWVHYVPVKEDLSDMVEKIEWAKANDQEARAIATEATRYSRTLNYEFAIRYGLQTVNRAIEATKELATGRVAYFNKRGS